MSYIDCPSCGGSGRIPLDNYTGGTRTCMHCGGSGKLPGPMALAHFPLCPRCKEGLDSKSLEQIEMVPLGRDVSTTLGVHAVVQYYLWQCPRCNYTVGPV